MKATTKPILILAGGLIVGGLLGYCLFGRSEEIVGVIEAPLPATELSEGLRGQYGIDKNINEKTIDNYLDRTDTVYRDVRMLVDGANWENKGGDRYLSGYVEGFEVIPAPYLAGFTDAYIAQKATENVSGLYTGETLFTLNENGSYVANYAESMDILEAIFPKDKNIFIMCGAGGYSGQVKNMLISLGWDENKLYNVGGYWYYEGENVIPVKQVINGEVYYDFSLVPYYNIDFAQLHTLTKASNENV